MKPWVFNSILGAAITVIVGGAVAWPGSWVSEVNARDDDKEKRLIQLETIIPRVEKHMERQQGTLDEIRDRTANIEGQLKRR